MWAPQIAAFAGWRIITPALPGFDGSAAGESSMEGFASHINSELDRLGIKRAVIGGLSLGGYVTFGVIRQRPERASALILADTRCGADNDEGRAARLRMIELLNQKGPLGVFDEMRPKLFGKTTQAERKGVVEEGKWMVESQSPAAVEGAIRAMLDRPDSAPLLSSIRVPTMVLVGDEDTMTPPSESERMHAGIAGSTLVKIPRAGHLSNLEDPSAFNAAVGGFLRTLD